MTTPGFLDTVIPLLTVVGPLVGVPLTVITFYLRSLREHQVSWHGETTRRLSAVEAGLGELRRSLDDFERNYTTKEEWLRECLHARRVLERVTEATVRIEATVHTILSAFRAGPPEGADLAVAQAANEPTNEEAC